MIAIRRGLRLPLAIIALGTLLIAAIAVAAQEPANDAFQQTWQRTDGPVAAGEVNRTWIWGPEPITGAIQEPYAESPGGMRTVQYFDKSRMEINAPDADQSSTWYVTNGLLVLEMVTGHLQVGDVARETQEPAEINVAGDPGYPNTPTYATLAGLLDSPPTPPGSVITTRLNSDGSITNDPSLARYGVKAGEQAQPENVDHTVAAPFWKFMTSEGLISVDGELVTGKLFENPFYATGFPITEAYWVRVAVDGVEQDVLMQAFERRILTYTPNNEPGWQVEAGNVGQHYYQWRYGEAPNPDGTPPANQPSPTPSPSPTPTPTPTPAPPPPSSETYQFVDVIGSFGHDETQLVSPGGVARNDDGLLYIADTGNDRIVVYSDSGETFKAVWGSSGSGPGEFDRPTDVAISPDGLLYVVDSGNHRIQVLNDKGEYVDGWGDFGSGQGEFRFPRAISLDVNGDVYVADTGNNRIQKFDASGNFIIAWGSFGAGEFEFNSPRDVAANRGGIVYVADTGNDRIVSFSTDGLSQLAEWGSEGSGPMQFDAPEGVVADTLGNVIIADTGNDRISVFSPEGDNLYDQWGGDGVFNEPTRLATDAARNLFIADSGYHRIVRYSPE